MKARVGKVTVGPVAFAILTLVVSGWLATDAAAQRGATRPRVQMPQGPVREVIRKNCTSCHGIDDYAFFALDRAGWQKLIETKHKPGDTTISSEDSSLLLDWMVSKFGPTTKPFPRSYIAPEITKFFSDPEARRLLDRACANCHELDRINQTRRTADGWRVLAVDMRERGARLTDEELEQLAEWLGRVRGTNESQ